MQRVGSIVRSVSSVVSWEGYRVYAVRHIPIPTTFLGLGPLERGMSIDGIEADRDYIASSGTNERDAVWHQMRSKNSLVVLVV